MNSTVCSSKYLMLLEPHHDKYIRIVMRVISQKLPQGGFKMGQTTQITELFEHKRSPISAT